MPLDRHRERLGGNRLSHVASTIFEEHRGACLIRSCTCFERSCAARHSGEVIDAGLGAFQPIFPGCAAGDPTKRPREAGLGRESGPEGDLRQGEFANRDVSHRLLQAQAAVRCSTASSTTNAGPRTEADVSGGCINGLGLSSPYRGQRCRSPRILRCSAGLCTDASDRAGNRGKSVVV